MKQKKLKVFATAAICLSVVCVATSVVYANGVQPKLSAYAAEHSESCIWNHYVAKDATSDVPGNKEYWVCCSDHGHSLTAPTVGTVNAGDKTLSDEQLEGLTTDDDRYVAPTSVQTIIDKVAALADFNSESTVFENMSYYPVLEKYNALSEANKARVTNRDKLLQFSDHYDVVIPASSLPDLPNTMPSMGEGAYWGSYKCYTCTLESGEKQTAADIVANIDFDKYESFSFAIYNPNQFTAWHFTGQDWCHYLDLTNNTVIESNPVQTTNAPEGWNKITLSSADMKTLFYKEGSNTQSIYFGPYLTYNLAYGLKNGDTIKVTSFYGVKAVA